MDRRAFIAASSAAVAASTLAGPALARNDRLQIGIIGTGLRAQSLMSILLKRPDVDYAKLMGLESGKFKSAEALSDSELADVVVEQIEIVAKYAGYIDRQHAEVEKALHYESYPLPADMDYSQVSALSIEARQILAKNKPQTLGLASRISGITPVTVSLLLVYLKKNQQIALGKSPAAAVKDVGLV